MFAPKPKVYGGASPARPQEVINQQGNPNMVGDSWDLPSDPMFGLSRADVYPDKRAGKWTRRFMNRWLT